MDIAAESLAKHAEWRGKLAFDPKMDIATRHDLAVAYTPGVAEPCKVIAENPEAAYDYTLKANTVAVVSDGSAVLGLGNIGPEAAMPVMEGKAALFKAFGGVDAFPICLDTQDTDEIVETVIRIAPAFGGINLEDIAAPRCFEIEARLNDALDIPVFHDDQHGTAIVVLSGIINALRLVGKDKESVRVVVNGAGSAGIAIAKLLLSYGFANVTMCDIRGILSSSYEGMNPAQEAMLEVTNLEDKSGTLADAMEGADIVIGVSAPGVITPDMVASMADDAIVFAMANPTPEIFPDEARAAGARVVGTGRSDFPNQVNNVIAFPGIFKGALQARAERITEPMKLAAAEALAALVSDEELTEEFIMPDPFDSRVADAVADAVEEGRVEYGILPLENSTAGTVDRVYDLLYKRGLYIARAITLRINHDLLAKPGVEASDIVEVFSHEQALRQCTDFIAQMPNEVTSTACRNTAMAASSVANSERRDVAAISSTACAELYGLNVLQHAIQDEADNFTRFICVAKKPQLVGEPERSSLLLITPHEAGALFRVLSRIAALGVNMLKLESRPIPGSEFEFMFYVDIECTPNDPAFDEVIAQIEPLCDSLAYLGSYAEVSA